jgi:hypothetical protein
MLPVDSRVHAKEGFYLLRGTAVQNNFARIAPDWSRRAATDLSPGQSPGFEVACSVSAVGAKDFQELFRHSVAHYQSTPNPRALPGAKICRRSAAQ